MKARNREVNIFNMSLLDILCGALGAFCFMMLVLFPYWKPKGATAEEIEKKYQEMAREMEHIKKELEKVPGSGDLQQRIDKLNRQVQEQKRQLDQARREAQQHKKDNDGLKMRRPFTISMNWDSPRHDVDLYVRWRGKSQGGDVQPPSDPTKQQGQFFPGDAYTLCGSGPCSETWLVRDVPLGTEFEIHYKFMDARDNPSPANVVSAAINGDNGFWVLPGAKMPQPKSTVFIGVVRLNQDAKLEFQPQPEFEARFREMNKSRLAPPSGEQKQPPQPNTKQGGQ